MSAQSIAILERALGKRKSGFAFPGREGEPSDMHVVTRAVARLMSEWEITDLHLHDLRRTGATMMTSERLNVMGEIVSRILNHTPLGPTVTLIYNRNTYLPQKRAALDAWANEVERLAGPRRSTAPGPETIEVRGVRGLRANPHSPVTYGTDGAITPSHRRSNEATPTFTMRAVLRTTM